MPAAVRAYLAARPPAVRRVLSGIRRAIREAVPDAVETFSYRMPGFRLHERALLWYAAWSAHVSLYPMSANLRAAHAAQLRGCEFSTGTIRFPLERPPSAALIRRVARARAAEVAAELDGARQKRVGAGRRAR